MHSAADIIVFFVFHGYYHHTNFFARNNQH